MSHREKVLAYFAWITVCIVWGTTYLAIRIAVRTLPDAFLAGVRFTVAGTLMALLLWIKGEKFPSFRQWGHLAIIGISLIGIGNWFVVWAEKVIPSGPAALLIAMTPFWMAGLESLIGKGEKWNRKMILGLLVGFVGVCLLVLPELKNTDWNRGYLIGIIALQIASAAWALGSLYSKYKKVESRPLVNASMEMIFGGVFLSIIAFSKGEFYNIQWELSGVISLAYLTIVGGMLAFVCYIYALSKLPSSTVSLYAYINPVIAVWLGWLILNEHITFYTFLATAVILSGIWLMRRNTGATV